MKQIQHIVIIGFVLLAGCGPPRISPDSPSPSQSAWSALEHMPPEYWVDYAVACETILRPYYAHTGAVHISVTNPIVPSILRESGALSIQIPWRYQTHAPDLLVYYAGNWKDSTNCHIYYYTLWPDPESLSCPWESGLLGTGSVLSLRLNGGRPSKELWRGLVILEDNRKPLPHK